MNVNICKWMRNANSPVLFMIDDLANAWVDTNKNKKIDKGEDWGRARYSENSSIKYLEEEILFFNNKVKVTFFVPVGKRVGMLKNSYNMFSYPINESLSSKEFFKSLHNNSKYEIAYHGTTHGIPGDNINEFKQEWETFKSLEEALNTIENGKKIYKDAIGEDPKGGKYCGYTSNEYSDKSIDLSGFFWWCRFCNIDTIREAKKDNYNKFILGEDINPLTNYDIKFFGENNIIDIPTTVNGGMLCNIYISNGKKIKFILKKILKRYLEKRKLKYIDYLLRNKLVISIQEHISPARDDGKIQTPNIFKDKQSLINILKYLKNKNVWYCTGSELASYVYYRENIKILFENKYKFKLNFDELVIRDFNYITLNIASGKEVITPNGKKINIYKNICTIPIESGIYTIC
ncbi:hypothetical protein ELS18_13795 [Clostridium perfringens]|uniref:hypothetical protein n=1 Tax=Clostridium perfringens TaxID=1502 RepID=UPI000F8DFEFA|nr:hypothetical protein [Clostridium perfringens]RUR35231.1 hypothetical protein ELS18_13795 [Clostridium perfringens]